MAYAEALRRRQSRWRQLWWQIHPGPLRWHRPEATRRDPAAPSADSTVADGPPAGVV
jgi:hypothetical protein